MIATLVFLASLVVQNNCAGANPCGTTSAPLATGYFVDCTNGGGANGSDSNNGTSYLTPWGTLSKVNSTVTATGADVWLKAGTTCANQILNVDWSGTDADRVVVGTYYVSAGAAYQLAPAVPLANPMETVYANGSRAKITGTTQNSCRISSSNHCPWTWVVTTPGAVPTSMYAGLVAVNAYYVTVQDLWVDGSAGMGMTVGRPAGVLGDGWNGGCQPSETDCAVYVTLQRNKMSMSMNDGVTVAYASHVVIRENEVTLTELSWGDSLSGVQDVGSPIAVANTSHVLVENNWIHDVYGDGIGSYSNIVLTRGNRMNSVLRGSLMLQGWNDNVAEQNIVVGGSIVDPEYPGQTRGNSFWPMAAGLEAPTGPHEHWGHNRVMFRANLVHAGGSSSCIHDYAASDYYNPAGKLDRILHKFIGNTCITTGTATLAFNRFDLGSPNTGNAFVDGMEFANNLFATSTATNAGLSNPTNALISWHHNQWGAQPSDTDLRGTGDVNSPTTGLGAFDFSLVSTTNFPTYLNFAPTGGAGATAASTADYSATGFVASDATWDWVLSQRQAIALCGANPAPPSKALFVQDSAYDFCGSARTSRLGGIN